MGSAVRLLGELGDPARFANGAALAAYVGVVPATSTSGARQPKSANISPVGHARLRRALWMPTLTAVRCNPWLRAFYERLIARGKKPKVALIAAMNKLLRAIWRVCHDRRPFELRTPHPQ
jgi:transposase